jgi:hypothetical protein
VRHGSEGRGRWNVEQNKQGVRAWIQSVRCGESRTKKSRREGSSGPVRCGSEGRGRCKVERRRRIQGVRSLGGVKLRGRRVR